MNIPLTFGDYSGRSGVVNNTHLVNMMVEPEVTGGATQYALVGTPGCLQFVDTGHKGLGRGGFSYPGYTICVVGVWVYLIEHSTAVATNLGKLTTWQGAIQWAENPSQIMFIDGVSGYVYTKESKSFTRITDADFPVPLACCFKDGYGVVVNANTGKIYVSALNNFSSWSALSFTTAEYEPDNLVSVISSHENLFAFGAKTTQPYYNSGNSTFPFDNRQGGNMSIGCGATNSPAKGGNVMFWLDNNAVVRKIVGYEQIAISTAAIEYRISQLSTFADACGYCYTQQGHDFYVLIFPTGGLTLVYDAKTEQWHSRTSYASDGRWRPAWIAQDGDLILAGDYTNGKVYKLDPETYTDNGRPIHWVASTQEINSDSKLVRHDMIEFRIESGVGVQGEDEPMFWTQYSDDGGKTWSHERWASMGKIGEFTKRARHYSLGRSRGRVYRIGGTSEVKRVIASARLEALAIGY